MKEKMSVPPAPPSVQLGKWKPWVHAVDNFVVIEPTRDGDIGCFINLNWFNGGGYVYPPNIVERLLGITLESKVARLRRHCQRWCDRQNRQIELVAKRFVN